ncbi:MAG: aldose 1-epimerase family protein [Peptostreptococcaceae bacterium]|jgi:galactose mutarotase-like enzyme|nr:aldose 1-epimerase family protein [Peptostreptococcaceae bacterium]
MEILKNQKLEIKIDKLGAQLTSIKDKENIEYLWTASEKYWARHAPILFPIVGKVKENKYKIDNKEYNLNQHGFARDSEFEILKNEDDILIYRLKYNEESLKKYPYKFELLIEYKLIDNKLQIKYKVNNLDDKKIYFSIGAHPGFNCPLLEGEKFEDYYLEFDKKENLKRKMVDNKLGLYTGEYKEFMEDEKIINLNRELFIDDAIVFKDFDSNKIALKNNKNQKIISMNFEDFKYLGIWTKTDDAPFICIEPWYGCADQVDFAGEFKDKEGIIMLDKKEVFECKYDIIIEHI